MRAFTLALAAIAAAASAASVPSVPPELAVIGEPSEILITGFMPSSSRTVLVRPGQTLNATDTENAPQPELGLVIHNSRSRFVFMMVDPDINATNPTYVGLHTAVTNLSVHDPSSSQTLAKYIAPMPDGDSPHNYTLLLFKQPSNFSIPSSFNSYFAFNPQDVWNRVNFPLQQFIAQTSLGKPIAANWFQEGPTTTSANTTASGTTTSGMPSSTTNAATGRPDGVPLALIFVGAVWGWM